MPQEFYGQMPPGFGQPGSPMGPPPVYYERPMDPAMLAAEVAAYPPDYQAGSPFDGRDPSLLGSQGPLSLPGPVHVPIGPQQAAAPQQPMPQQAAAPQQAPPPPAPPAAQAPQLDRLGPNPADVRAMLTERARRQYEQRFGTHAPGTKATPDARSMAAQGQQGDLNALIERIHRARMGHMADTRARRRGQRG